MSESKVMENGVSGNESGSPDEDDEGGFCLVHGTVLETYLWQAEEEEAYYYRCPVSSSNRHHHLLLFPFLAYLLLSV